MTDTALPAPGDQVHVAMSKWGDRPHWEFDGRWLGSDEHGHWVGAPRGTPHARPGYAFVSEVDTVTLFPREEWCCATFHRPGIWCDTYVDMSTPPVIEGSLVRAIDLDLDVIRLSRDGTPPPSYAGAPVGPGAVYLDDKDEFAEHRVEYGYPDDVVTAVEESARRVLAAIRSQSAPYDDATA